MPQWPPLVPLLITSFSIVFALFLWLLVFFETRGASLAPRTSELVLLQPPEELCFFIGPIKTFTVPLTWRVFVHIYFFFILCSMYFFFCEMLITETGELTVGVEVLKFCVLVPQNFQGWYSPYKSSNCKNDFEDVRRESTSCCFNWLDT